MHRQALLLLCVLPRIYVGPNSCEKLEKHGVVEKMRLMKWE